MTKHEIITTEIDRIINECEGVKTFIFNITDQLSSPVSPKPGQFVMVWVPGVDEVPMSLSAFDEKGNWAITVKKVGECTEALHQLKIGESIGVRGPLGNGFDLPMEKKDLFLVGGGMGMAPLRCLATRLNKLNLPFTLIQGGRKQGDLMFMDEFFDYGRKESEFMYCTDDGSYGEEGLATDLFENAIKDYTQADFRTMRVYTCGPEPMMHALFQACEKYGIPLQASLERMMRCGCGLCGLCALDSTGKLVCQDGPVFKSEDLREMDDFGRYKRDFTGRKVPFQTE